MNMLARPFVTAAAAIFLAGCVPMTRFQRPELPDTRSYGSEAPPAVFGDASAGTAQWLLPEAPLPDEWWRSFESDALDRIVRQALDANRTLAAAAASLEQAQELANARAGGRLPQVELAAGVGRQKYGAQFLGTLPKPPPFTYFAAGPAVSYTLDYTGAIGHAIERQQALARYQQQQLVAARLAVSGNVVLQALQSASLQAQLDAVDELLERDRQILRLVRIAFENGSVSRLDVTSAESQLATDQTLVPPLRKAIGVARNALALLLGSSPGQASIPALDLSRITLPAELPLSVPSELARHRPDILAAEAQLHAATAALGIAQGNLYPHLTLTASTGFQSVAMGDLFDGGSGVWGLAAGLVAPLFDGGTLRAEKRAAAAQVKASAANYEQTVLSALTQVANSLQALEQDAALLQAQSAAQASARETAELTRRAYEEGEVGVLQVLDAERRYQQARLGYIRALAERYSDTAEFFLALGAAA